MARGSKRGLSSRAHQRRYGQFELRGRHKNRHGREPCFCIAFRSQIETATTMARKMLVAVHNRDIMFIDSVTDKLCPICKEAISRACARLQK